MTTRALIMSSEPTIVSSKMSNNTENTTNKTQNTQNTSYVSVAKTIPKVNFPKRDQAIVLHSEESLKLHDYVQAIGNIVQPKNICFASRISNNRICIYLANKELVEQLMQTHPSITIGNINLNIRRLVSSTKRIVISNVSPCIPHERLTEVITNLGLQLASPVSFLKAGIPGDDYSHILSFRRQAYIFPPNENFELQTSVLVQHDGNDSRIFLSTDRMECFICKQTGHVASNCPNPQTSHDAYPASTSQTQVSKEISTTPSSVIFKTKETTPLKRGISEVLSSSDQTSQPELDSVVVTEEDNSLPEEENSMPPPKNPTPHTSDTKRIKKKLKLETPTAENILSQISKKNILKAYQKDPTVFHLPYNNIVAFLENSFGSSTPYSEAKKFTNDVKLLLQDLHNIYPLAERSLKNRITRMSKKIKIDLKDDAIDIGSLHSLDTMSDDDDLSDSISQSSKASQ